MAGTTAPAGSTVGGLDLGQLQGNILRGYGRTYGHVRHLVLSVRDPARARAALAAMVDADGSTRSTLEVTRGDRAPKDAGLASCLNVGITHAGLAALGLPKASLDTFPREFRLGMVARAAELGDVGTSAPQHWIPGLADETGVHLLVTIHAQRREDLTPVSNRVLDAQGCRAFTLVTAEPLDGAVLPDDRVHFGYRDGIAGPRFEHVHPPDPTRPPLSPLGVILLGHRVPSLGMTWRVPQPATLGVNGTFGAFRVLRQDVAAFEAFLAETAAATRCSVAEVAAKLCGRWRNGMPLALAPTERSADEMAATEPEPDLKALEAFGYRRTDPEGARCPLGSHIRRSNPRDAHIVQRGTNAHRIVVRRGMPYGPAYDPTGPSGSDRDTDVARGLLGNFLCASIPSQFEVLQRDWLNLGLQDPRITGTNDPLVGANDGRTSEFRWTTSRGDRVVTSRLPSFVTTRGGAYYFVPSIPAVRWIGAAGWR
jgi:Dyp-type peroxidase family